MNNDRWTHEELEENLRQNSDSGYGSMVGVAALYKSIYGVFPKIGLSGQQAEFAQHVFERLPDFKVPKETELDAT